MDTMWFDRKPGERVSVGKDDPAVLMISEGVPDWVRLPDELGGGKVKVSRAAIGPCPSCDTRHEVRFLILSGSPYTVAECPKSGFLWCEMPKSKTEE